MEGLYACGDVEGENSEWLFRLALQRLQISFDPDNIIILTEQRVPIYVKFIASLGRKFNFIYGKPDKNTGQDEEWKRLWMDRMDELCERSNDFNEFQTFKIIKANVKGHQLLPTTEAKVFILTQERRTERFLDSHKDIMIVAADKGGKTVIMDRKIYTEKLIQHMNDGMEKGIYRKVTDVRFDDIKVSMEKRYERIRHNMKHYLDLDARTGFLHERIFTGKQEYVMSEIRIAIKIHKDGMPARPIIAAPRRWCKSISRWILRNLNLIANLYDDVKVKSSEHFVEKIATLNQVFDEGFEIATYDYESMYTNIPKCDAFAIIDRNFHEIERCTCMPRELFFDILQLLIDSSAFFWCNGEIYEQFSGITMGNDLSQVLADIVTNRAAIITRKHFSKAELPFMCKYVDDFATIMKKQISGTFHSHIEQQVKGLPIKKEEMDPDGKITYLDVMMHRNEEKQIITQWYQKSCSARKILDFHSNHPTLMKRNMIREFMRHALKLTHATRYQETIRKITSTLRRSSYPKSMIMAEMKKILRSIGGIHVTSSYGNTDETIDFENEILAHELATLKRNATAKQLNANQNGCGNRRKAESIKKSKVHDVYLPVPFCDNKTLTISKNIMRRRGLRYALAPRMMNSNSRNFKCPRSRGNIAA